MPTIVIGLFESPAEAETVLRELEATSFSSEDVQILTSRPDIEADPPLGGSLDNIGTESGLGIGTAIASASYYTGIIRTLRGMGVPEDESEDYSEGVRRGGALVIVKSGEERADAVADLLNHYHAIHVDERATEWSAAGWKRQFARAGQERGLSPHHMQTESVQVGRTRSDAGGARVFVW
ncbi:MAG TPA: hypothetical protein VF767_03555 [Bryobacteraceae bacterium]